MPVVNVLRVAGHVLIVGFVVMSTGCSTSRPHVWAEETRRLSVPADGLENLKITTHNGLIEVTGEVDCETLQVVALCRAGGNDKASAREALAALEVVSRDEGATHVLTHRWAQRKRRSWEAQVAFTVTSPPHLALKATTHNGAVTVRGLEAETTLRTHNGPIKLATATAPVAATSHNGSIRATLSGNEVALTTHNGPITVVLEGEGPIAGAIRTHNGPIEVRLAGQRDARVLCQTANGGITCRKPMMVERATPHRMEGVLGNGDTELSLRTHNGSIRVHP